MGNWNRGLIDAAQHQILSNCVSEHARNSSKNKNKNKNRVIAEKEEPDLKGEHRQCYLFFLGALCIPNVEDVILNLMESEVLNFWTQEIEIHCLDQETNSADNNLNEP